MSMTGSSRWRRGVWRLRGVSVRRLRRLRVSTSAGLWRLIGVMAGGIVGDPIGEGQRERGIWLLIGALGFPGQGLRRQGVPIPWVHENLTRFNGSGGWGLRVGVYRMIGISSGLCGGQSRDVVVMRHGLGIVRGGRRRG